MTEHDLVLVVDFGAQYAQLIARRVREAKVYSEIVPHTAPVAEIVARRPKAIILSGGPQVGLRAGGAAGGPRPLRLRRTDFGDLLRLSSHGSGAGRRRRPRGLSEFGRTQATIIEPGTLLADLPASLQVWMSHGDAVAAAPAGFRALASSAGAPIAPSRTLAVASRACSGI